MATLIKRLTLDMTADEHRRLKTIASFHGVTMKDFLLSNILPETKIFREKTKVEETAYLLKSAANKKRLIAALGRSGNKNKSFSSLKELKHALGI
jgi:uncharacterized protein (DUF1778 family)